jgi:hypothetical protein
VKEVPVPEEDKEEYLCTFYDEDDCRFSFMYTEDEDNKIVVKAQEDRDCPPKVFMLGIVLAVMAAIVLIGMAILVLWKVLTTIHDRREFARFEKERMMAKWDTVSALYILYCICSNYIHCLSGRKSNLQTSNVDIQESHLCWQIKTSIHPSHV